MAELLATFLILQIIYNVINLAWYSQKMMDSEYPGKFIGFLVGLLLSFAAVAFIIAAISRVDFNTINLHQVRYCSHERI